MRSAVKPGVLMVTGAYWPELSGGGLQCRTMINALRDRFDFTVLTTCTDPGLPAEDNVDGIAVTRVQVSLARPWSKVAAAMQTTAFLLKAARGFEIVHLHGFSQKSILIALLSRLLGKRVVITIHTAGQDDPGGAQRLGAMAYWAYRKADRFIAISNLMAERYRAAALPESRLRVAPNGIDTGRFRPAQPGEREQFRAALGLPGALPVVLFVGFFSSDKRPNNLYEAWLQLRSRHGVDAALVFVGATESPYYEVDRSVSALIQQDARVRGVEHRLRFTGEVRDVERYYRAADVLVVPSIREAFGMALIEGMSSSLPVIATRIAGVTDTIIEDGITGILVPPDDPAAIADSLAVLLTDGGAAARLGAAARTAVEARFSLDASRARWAGIYEELVRR